MKAVIIWRGTVPLLKNERDEWKLPGGKLELGETPTETASREIAEELAWDVTVHQPSHAWVYQIRPARHVFVLTYAAEYAGDLEPKSSNEHKDPALVPIADVAALNMPNGYKVAIHKAAQQIQSASRAARQLGSPSE